NTRRQKPGHDKGQANAPHSDLIWKIHLRHKQAVCKYETGGVNDEEDHTGLRAILLRCIPMEFVSA
ncbi:MAG: hypothetical protein WCI20_10125, partial [bacterium]